jgi:NADPH:quinone reductase-like Zn-dependent oxidoreductase
MKAILIHEHGGLNQVFCQDWPKPDLEPGQVLVRMRAAALNHLDLYVVHGLPGVRLDMPHILGSDGAGIVEAVGEGADGRLSRGDRVMLNAVLWCGRCEFCAQGEQSLCVRLKLVGEHSKGTFAEYFVVPERNLELIPDGVGFEEAAAFSLVFQTAWRMLVTRGNIQPGQDLFIHGIGGGVSTAALAIAKMSSCRVFVSSSSDEKLERARALGADFCYNYSRDDVVAHVMRDTGKRGVDVVVDNAGASTWLQSLQLARKGGKLLTCGATTGANPRTEIRLIFWKQLQVLGSTMSSVAEYRTLIGLLARGLLKPTISRVFPLEEGCQALQYLREGQQFGKVVLTLPD